jgi:hypothetical protein
MNNPRSISYLELYLSRIIEHTTRDRRTGRMLPPVDNNQAAMPPPDALNSPIGHLSPENDATSQNSGRGEFNQTASPPCVRVCESWLNLREALRLVTAIRDRAAASSNVTHFESQISESPRRIDQKLHHCDSIEQCKVVVNCRRVPSRIDQLSHCLTGIMSMIA